VAVEAVDGSALLRVCDDGVGIAPEMLPRLFDPFVQGAEVLLENAVVSGLDSCLPNASWNYMAVT
jgi:hypothetical protein